MWKQLQSCHDVHTGDQIRYTGNSSFTDSKALYTVTKTDQYYFEIIPAARSQADHSFSDLARRIVRYFDIGYHIGLEVWTED